MVVSSESVDLDLQPRHNGEKHFNEGLNTGAELKNGCEERQVRGDFPIANSSRG